MNLKYIVIENRGNESIILFPDWMRHDDVARKMNTKVISAGMCDLESRQCFGESVSLKIKSRPEDSELLKYWR